MNVDHLTEFHDIHTRSSGYKIGDRFSKTMRVLGVYDGAECVVEVVLPTYMIEESRDMVRATAHAILETPVFKYYGDVHTMLAAEKAKEVLEL